MRATSFCIGVCILLFQAGSVCGQTVTVDWETKAPFADYRTYMWKDSDDQGPRYYRQWVEKGVDTELAKRDFQKVAVVKNPSVYLYSYIATQQMVDSTAKDNRFGWLRAPLGFRRDWEGWGEGIDTDPDIAERKDERRMTRVLFINMVDSMKKALIWRGEATGTISDSKEKEEKQVLKSIHKMFKQFPPGEK